MLSNGLVFTFVVTISVAQQKSYDNFKVFRVKTYTQQNLDTLSKIEGIDTWHDGRVGGHADIMVAPYALEKVQDILHKNNLSYSTMIEDVQRLIAEEKVSAVNPINSNHPMTWDSYHDQDDIEAFLDYLVATYEFVEVESIGESYEGRPMRVLKICKGGCGDKPTMWIDAGIHAREWISPATCTWMIRELIENDAKHPQLLNDLDWYILPIVNPDGYAFTQTSDRLWRKTRSDYGQSGCYGVDANRNWGYHWNDGGTSDNGCSDIYLGPEPFSEVENRNVRDFILAHKDQIKFFNTLHSYGQFILLPWGFTRTEAPDHERRLVFATQANEALMNVHGKFYDVGCIPCILYEASGGSLDWALGEAGIPYSFAMELRDFGVNGFLLPPAEIIPTAEEAWAFHETAAKMIIEEFVK